uniref:Uncharacterized protein n=1 Tax=Brassica campestris TaxID=3711 RepID=A0A3P5Z031_BRACM|nr:unnamed protein product [Brassica rapa]
MASEKFGPHLPTIIEGKHIKPLYELWGIDYAVEALELPSLLPTVTKLWRL